MDLLEEFREFQRNNPLKGDMNGECNVTSCKSPYAIHFNRITERWYCTRCARKLNENDTPDDPICDWPTEDMMQGTKRIKV